MTAHCPAHGDHLPLPDGTCPWCAPAPKAAKPKRVRPSRARRPKTAVERHRASVIDFDADTPITAYTCRHCELRYEPEGHTREAVWTCSQCARERANEMRIA